jgi:hypothetical protein
VRAGEPQTSSSVTRDGTMTSARCSAPCAATDTGSVFDLGSVPGRTPVFAGRESELPAWLSGRSDGATLSREPSGPLPDIPPIY